MHAAPKNERRRQPFGRKFVRQQRTRARHHRGGDGDGDGDGGDDDDDGDDGDDDANASRLSAFCRVARALERRRPPRSCSVAVADQKSTEKWAGDFRRLLHTRARAQHEVKR